MRRYHAALSCSVILLDLTLPAGTSSLIARKFASALG
jgi:hypothetical protein